MADPTLGPTLVVAPSAKSPNNVGPIPPTLAALVTFGQVLKGATLSLKGVLDSLGEATKQFAGALVAVRAIAGVADAADDTFQFHNVGNIPPNPTAASQLKVLRQKADALASAFHDKTGDNPNPRAFVKELDTAIGASATTVVNLLRDPVNLKIVQAFCDDPMVDDRRAYIEIWGLGQIVALALDLLGRTESANQALEMAQEVLEQHDEKQSVPAIALKKAKSSWKGFVAATTAAAGAATGTVGNLPGGADSLSIALLKIFAAHRLAKAALHKPEAGSLESELFSLVVDALQLSDAQKATLTGLKEDLKKSQAEVIRKAKQEAVAAANVPDGPPRAVRATTQKLAQKSNERLLAEQDCKAKAEKLSTFYEDTYGPENQKIFGTLQSGAFMDGFITLLLIVQLVGAFQELDDPDISRGQKAADIGLNTVLTMAAVIAVVGKNVRTIDIGIAKLDLAAVGRVAEALSSKPAVMAFGVFAGVMALISGGAQIVDGFTHDEVEEIIVGSVNAVSGALIVYGALFSATVATGVGVGLGVLLAVYAVGVVLMDAAKNPTQKAIEQLIDSLEKNKVFTSKTAVQHLGLDSQLEDVKNAIATGCSQLLRNPQGDPTREALLAKMQLLGFSEADSMSLVESASDENVRLNPDLAPAPIVPTP